MNTFLAIVALAFMAAGAAASGWYANVGPEWKLWVLGIGGLVAGLVILLLSGVWIDGPTAGS